MNGEHTDEDYRRLMRTKTRLLKALKKAEAWMDAVGSGVESKWYARVSRQVRTAIEAAIK